MAGKHVSKLKGIRLENQQNELIIECKPSHSVVRSKKLIFEDQDNEISVQDLAQVIGRVSSFHDTFCIAEISFAGNNKTSLWELAVFNSGCTISWTSTLGFQPPDASPSDENGIVVTHAGLYLLQCTVSDASNIVWTLVVTLVTSTVATGQTCGPPHVQEVHKHSGSGTELVLSLAAGSRLGLKLVSEPGRPIVRSPRSITFKVNKLVVCGNSITRRKIELDSHLHQADRSSKDLEELVDEVVDDEADEVNDFNDTASIFSEAMSLLEGASHFS